MRSMEKEGPVAPQRTTGACRPAHGRGRGGLSPPPPRAIGGPVAPSPHLSPKIPPKIQKKERSEEKESGEALLDSALVICMLVHLVYIFLYLSNTYLSRSNLSMGE